MYSIHFRPQLSNPNQFPIVTERASWLSEIPCGTHWMSHQTPSIMFDVSIYIISLDYAGNLKDYYMY